jgi:integrase
MILLAYRHGLRASEICGLQLPDIDQKSGSITAERLMGSLKTVQPIYEHRGQPLLDEKEALREWMKKRPADGSSFVFTSQNGGRLDRHRSGTIDVEAVQVLHSEVIPVHSH